MSMADVPHGIKQWAENNGARLAPADTRRSPGWVSLSPASSPH